MPKGRKLSLLAEDLGADIDEVLVTLWDAGIEELEDPDDVVPLRMLPKVNKALGVISYKQRTTVDYWVSHTGLSRAELAATLENMGLQLSPNARRLPKGALRRLSRIYSGGQSDPAPVEEQPPAELPLKWEVIGAEREVRLLTVEEISGIHTALEEDFALTNDPIVPAGVRDENLLGSAVGRPATSFGNDRKYPTIEMATAALFHSLIHNHPFFNGNKRTALVSLLAQLDQNDLVLTATENDLFRFTLRTAQHRLVKETDERPDREVLEIAKWIKSNSRTIERGERPMRWGKLRQRLREFDCDSTPSSGVGNRLNISRRVARIRRFGVGSKTRPLTTQVAWSGDGTDADRSTIHKIRKDLQLDDEHDVDSATFYAGAKVDAFIIDYRRILQRLAKL